MPALSTPAAVPTAPLPLAARDLLVASARGLGAAAAAASAERRYTEAHLAALRAAAALLAARARPQRGRSRVRSVWSVLPSVAPDLAEWAAFFAGSAPLRAAVEAGLPAAVTPRAADDLLRDAETFLDLVCDRLGVDHHPGLDAPVAGRLRPVR